MDSADYVGESTYLFYDIETACIRITDGTPGGRPACIEGSAGGVSWGSITGTLSDQLDLQAELDALVYTLPVADVGVLGGIQEGGDITIDANGIVTVVGGTGGTTTTDVAPSATSVIETIDTTSVISVKFLIVVEDLTTGDSRSFESHAFVGLGQNVFNMHSVMGDRLRYSIALVSNGTDKEIQLTNNEANTLRIRVAKLGSVAV